MYALTVTSFARAAVVTSARGTLSACGVVVELVDEIGVVELPCVPIVVPPESTSQYHDIVDPEAERYENLSVAPVTVAPEGTPRLPNTSLTYFDPLNWLPKVAVV